MNNLNSPSKILDLHSMRTIMNKIFSEKISKFETLVDADVIEKHR